MKIDFRQIKFNEKQIKKINDGLNKYLSIMESLKNEKDIVKDLDFQTKFNGFYRIRRNADWRKKYYKIFEDVLKENENSFENILCAIFKETGRVEASFSSKMLASINSSSPIWDSNVLNNLDLSQPKGNGKQKLINAIRIFNQLEAIYNDLLANADLHFFIEEFDNTFPSGKNISIVKKIDFYIWSK